MSVLSLIHKGQPRDKGGVAQVKFYKKKPGWRVGWQISHYWTIQVITKCKRWLWLWAGKHISMGSHYFQWYSFLDASDDFLFWCLGLCWCVQSQQNPRLQALLSGFKALGTPGIDNGINFGIEDMEFLCTLTGWDQLGPLHVCRCRFLNLK
jgi:hypothetical protein